MRQTFDRRKSRGQRVADAICAFAGSAWFIAANATVFALWMAVNVGWIPGIAVFDAPPFNLLSLVTSLEAIFLSAFILISQTRMTELADQRSDLDLQINLLAEYEITRLIALTDAIATKLGVTVAGARGVDIEELKRIVDPKAVLDEIERTTKPA